MRINFDHETQRLAVIGDPIAHSLSPVIHNALYNAMGINAFYQPLHIPKGRIESMRDAIPMLSLKGFNITMPHKQAIFPLLDEISDQARLYQSVNTVCVQDGRLTGHSTDAQGFSLSLAEHGVGMEGQDIVILGAGGVTGTLALHAATNGARTIAILNRTVARAEALAAHIYEQTGKKIAVGGFHSDDLSAFASRATLLINATPLGMHGCTEQFESLEFLRALLPGAVVCDLIYSPSCTLFLHEARALGHRAFNGLGMLVYQAFVAFEHFFGIMPGAEEKLAVEQALRSERGIALD
ncbi:MAG: shikimate dehydrogenase [Bacillota bacterium]